jgi:hypothetical protein
MRRPRPQQHRDISPLIDVISIDTPWGYPVVILLGTSRASLATLHVIMERNSKFGAERQDLIDKQVRAENDNYLTCSEKHVTSCKNE